MKVKKVDLVDAITLSVLYNTFKVPSDEEIAAICVGSSIKVCNGDERFWVKVIEVIESGEKWLGRIDNNLIQRGLCLGDIIEVNHFNIYDIYE